LLALFRSVSLPAMRVFVTGASGFVGRRLVPRLLDVGHVVQGTDREIDVTRPEALASALADWAPDAVIHLAALSSVAASWREPELCYRINFLGTRHLLEAVRGHCPRARLLLIGSADQYAATTPRERPFEESMPLRPRSPYARAKAAAELLGDRYAAEGLDVVRVRAFNHTGAGQSDEFVVSSFARQLAEIRRGEREPRMRVGNLDSVRDFLHVDDVIRAYLALLDPAVPADVYNVASERASSIRDVLEGLANIAGITPEVEVDTERWRETDWLVGDAARLRRVTGWQPRIALDAILRELFDHWLREVGAP
jgi:GDP-4-dehydro-6-deoxy-D-mannose reductase